MVAIDSNLAPSYARLGRDRQATRLAPCRILGILSASFPRFEVDATQNCVHKKAHAKLSSVHPHGIGDDVPRSL